MAGARDPEAASPAIAIWVFANVPLLTSGVERTQHVSAAIPRPIPWGHDATYHGTLVCRGFTSTAGFPFGVGVHQRLWSPDGHVRVVCMGNAHLASSARVHHVRYKEVCIVQGTC